MSSSDVGSGDTRGPVAAAACDADARVAYSAKFKHFTRVHRVRDMDALVAQITMAETSLER